MNKLKELLELLEVSTLTEALEEVRLLKRIQEVYEHPERKTINELTDEEYGRGIFGDAYIES